MNGTPKPTVIDGRIVLLPLSAREVEAIVGGTKSVIDLDNLRTVNAAAREAESSIGRMRRRRNWRMNDEVPTLREDDPPQRHATSRR